METCKNFTTEQSINMTQKLSKTLLVSYIGNCILNVLLSPTATFGNIVIAVSLRKISTLHAPSRALYTSLCLSDLGVGVIAHPLYAGYLIAEMNDQHQSKHGAVYSIHNVMSVFLCAISLLTMTAITVDRLLAIRLKLRYREMVTLRRVTIALAFSYILSALVASSYLRNNNLYLYATYSAVLICALVSSVCCLLVYVTIHKHRRIQVCSHVQLRRFESNRKEASFNMVSHRRSFLSTLYMYGSFSVCHLPYVCLKIAGRVTGWNQALWAAFYWSGTLVLINSSLNPLLFCWRIEGIKHAAKNTVQVFFPCLKLETRIEHPRPSLFQPCS